MPFQITVTGESLHDCLVQLGLELGVFTPEEPAAAPAPAAEQAPAPEPAPAPEQAAAPAQAKAPDSEALRTEIRAVLTPHMRGDRAAEAKALVKKFGPSGLSSVPEDSLAALLSEVKETFK